MDEPNGAPEDARLASRGEHGRMQARPSVVADHRRVLRGDCARCAGLCCVALAFDRSDWFSFDKPSNVPCRHLLMTHRCAVHHSLEQRGLSGCAHYDCHGAGQRVTEELFAGRSWREHPELAPAMMAAFRVLQSVHELRLLLYEASQLDLPPLAATQRVELLARLEPATGWTVATTEAFDIGRCHADVSTFLRALRGIVSAPRDGPRRRLPVVR